MRNDKEQTTSSEEMVTISRAEYENMQAQIQWLMEQLRLSRQKRFGASSEHSSEDAMEQMSFLFNEAEAYGDQTAKEDDSSIVVAAHKRHKRHEYTLDELSEKVPVEVVEHRCRKESRTSFPAALPRRRLRHILWCRSLSWDLPCTGRSRNSSARVFP